MQKITSQVNVKCANVDAESIVKLTITANNSAGNIIHSDNDNLVFVISDKNGNELTPNDKESAIPFKVNNGFYKTSIQAWPVSTTGNVSKPGKFTAYGFLNVNFD